MEWPTGSMRTRPAIALATLGVALSLASACTRTSDGSVVMRRPLLGNLLGFRKEEEAARIVPSRALTQPPPQTVAAARPLAVIVPSMQIARNPPFKKVDPDKPLACSNVKSASGRIRVVCS